MSAVSNYVIIAGCAAALRQQRRLHRFELRRARAEKRLAEAKVEQVRVSLDEAGAVATLRGIEAKIHSQPLAAEDTILELCRELRKKLRPARRQSGSFRAAGTGRESARTTRFASPLLTHAAVGVLLSVVEIVQSLMTVRTVPWPQIAQLMMIYLSASASSPLIILASRRIRIRADSWQWSTSILIGICVGHGLVNIGILSLVGRVTSLVPYAPYNFPAVVAVSLALTAALQSAGYGREARQALRDSVALGHAAADVHLNSLRTQLAPHFLFNTLNSILVSVRPDPEAAVSMLRRLRHLVERTACRRMDMEVPVREELDVTMMYVEIERTRFGEALDLRLETDDAALQLLTPPFLLQPLVENAIRHGILGTSARSAVLVRLHEVGGMLQIEVENDAHITDPASWRRGIGLTNIKSLLELMYRETHEISVMAVGDRGVRVRICIPAKHAWTSSSQDGGASHLLHPRGRTALGGEA